MAMPTALRQSPPAKLPASSALAAVPQVIRDVKAAVETIRELDEDAGAFVTAAMRALGQVGAVAREVMAVRPAYDRTLARLPQSLKSVPTITGPGGERATAAARAKKEAELHELVLAEVERARGPRVASAADTAVRALESLRTELDDLQALKNRPTALALTPQDREVLSELRLELETLDAVELHARYVNILTRIRRAEATNDSRLGALLDEERLFIAATRPILHKLVKGAPGVWRPGLAVPSTAATAKANSLLSAFRTRKDQLGTPTLQAAEEIFARLRRCFTLLAGRDAAYHGPGGLTSSELDALAKNPEAIEYHEGAVQRALYREQEIAFDPWQSKALDGLNKRRK